MLCHCLKGRRFNRVKRVKRDICHWVGWMGGGGSGKKEGIFGNKVKQE